MIKQTILIAVVLFLLGLLLISCKNDNVNDAGTNDSWTFVKFGDTQGDFYPGKNPPYNSSTATGVSIMDKYNFTWVKESFTTQIIGSST